MKFRKLSVAGVAWLHDADLPTAKRKKLIHKTRKKGKQPAKGQEEFSIGKGCLTGRTVNAST